MTIAHHTPLVLASGSAIRAQMLKGCGLQFSVAPSNVDEEAIKKGFEIGDAGLGRLAGELSRAKALNVAPAYPDHLTIGADQLCVLENSIFDKPETREAAIEQLMQLQGQTHQQISAVCLARGSEVMWEHQCAALLTMRALTEAEAAAYIDADLPLKSCGAYKYESLGKHLFAEVLGEDATIKGLPLQPLLAQLHGMGAIALEGKG